MYILGNGDHNKLINWGLLRIKYNCRKIKIVIEDEAEEIELEYEGLGALCKQFEFTLGTIESPENLGKIV